MELIKISPFNLNFTKRIYSSIGNTLEKNNAKTAAFLAVTIVKIFDVVELALTSVIGIALLAAFPFAYVVACCKGHSNQSARNKAPLHKSVFYRALFALIDAFQNAKNIFNVMPYVRIVQFNPKSK